MVEASKRAGLRLLILIGDQQKEKEAVSVFEKACIPMRFHMRAEGTATDDWLDALGLSRNRKSVIMCIVPKHLSPRLLSALADELTLKKPGNGIAFIIPVSSISHALAKLMDKKELDSIQAQIDKEVELMSEKAHYSLILALVNQGYSDDLMDVAKTAGASGGTVMHSRQCGMEATQQFWGISIQSEREIIAILTPREKKVDIMKAITKKCGVQTEAGGIVFSLPVEDMMGVTFQSE